jgi:hypothetical protein
MMRNGSQDLPTKARAEKRRVLRYPDFRVILLAAAFPPVRAVTIEAAFITDHSGGAVPDFHRLPCSS